MALAIVAVAWIMFGPSKRSYTVQAHFYNAGRLVEGGDVRIAGRKVGSISGVDLTPDGLAGITLSITDETVLPLRRGLRADIRAVGSATLTNNFVELTPGPTGAPSLRDGAVLPVTQTSGIVDLDAVLSSLDPSARADIRDLIANSAQVYAGSGSRYFNRMLAKLDPALAEVRGVTEELASDRAQIGRLVIKAAQAARAISSRRSDLRAAVGNTARTLEAIASEREALADALVRAPAVLGQGRRTLANLTTAVTAMRPALREVPPAGRPLGTLLQRLNTMLPRAVPVVSQLREQLPGLRESLLGYPRLQRPAIEALKSTGAALQDSRHVLRGLRIYGPDFLLGILNGLVTVASGTYNKSGHYIHIAFSEPPETLFAGLGRTGPLDELASVPGLFKLQRGLDARCPGANAPPAPDGSSPWIPDPLLCNPAHSIPASVNQP
ncbi:MAG: MlaD family protein [Thermoleophilaceae bacterium]